jgi:hypothetical protein
MLTYKLFPNDAELNKIKTQEICSDSRMDECYVNLDSGSVQGHVQAECNSKCSETKMLNSEQTLIFSPGPGEIRGVQVLVPDQH